MGIFIGCGFRSCYAGGFGGVAVTISEAVTAVLLFLLVAIEDPFISVTWMVGGRIVIALAGTEISGRRLVGVVWKVNVGHMVANHNTTNLRLGLSRSRSNLSNMGWLADFSLKHSAVCWHVREPVVDIACRGPRAFSFAMPDCVGPSSAGTRFFGSKSYSLSDHFDVGGVDTFFGRSLL